MPPIKGTRTTKNVLGREERQRIHETVSGLVKELDIEKRRRRQADRLNKKLGKELADTRAHFSQAMKQLECERRFREILEPTCDELARGIGVGIWTLMAAQDKCVK
ncbi:unnamed protein product [Amaranthus hypochondriacus]